MSEQRERVFVYGTLMTGMGNDRLLSGAGPAEFVGRGVVSGVLHAVSGFPGMIDGPGAVRGEVHDVTSETLMMFLDALEGCWNGRTDGMYRRVRRAVSLDDGTVTEAWAYLWNRGPSGPVIADGDYRAWREQERTYSAWLDRQLGTQE